MAEPQVKGMAVINARNWFDERLGAGWFTRAARALDPDWPDRVLPGDWYPVRVSYGTYLSAFEALDGYESAEDLMAIVAGEVALNDLNGILRAFLWVASPKMFLRTAPKIWETYANFTTLEPLANDPGCYRIKVTEIPAEYIDWVAAAWRGFLSPALELAGGKNPRSNILERGRTPGADTCELVYELRYE